MLLWIAVILFVLWLLGFIALPSLGWVVHILIVLAIIALIFHFVRGRSTV
ncbi:MULTISPECIES: lmo0937 family membrane protein [Sinomonas]|uniref:Lmo0937 family membrane protein n=1 Tax=Sinomonas flava TaxID=496857 RepID=A0ABP5NRY3_9MICC|nr:lmo0937 family membrane protein [Sinomonas sp. R1AF57]